MLKCTRFCVFLYVAVVGAVVFFGTIASAQPEVPRMTKEDLKPLLANPAVTIIDVRSQSDWEDDTLMIKGAVREDPMKTASWMDRYPKERTLVFYCA
jgi:hypothetical protein